MIKSTDKLCFLGDSITEGVATDKRYIDYIAEETGAKVYGFGVNGAQTIDLSAQIERMESTIGNDFDVLFILIGTNDYMAGVPLGEFFIEHTEKVVTEYDAKNKPINYAERKKREFSYDERTFKGRLNKLFGYIKDAYFDKRVILLTPLHRSYAYFGGANVQPNELYANSTGIFFDEYVDALRKAADVWALESIDLYRESGLFPLNEKHAEKYFNLAANDSLHPNAAGHYRIAQAILRNV